MIPILTVRAGAGSLDGTLLAVAGDDGVIFQWDTRNGEPLPTLRGDGLMVQALAYSPNGKFLASGGESNTVRLWASSTAEELADLRGHTDTVMSLSWSPDGERLASAGRDKTIRLWDPIAGRELITLRGHSDGITSISWSPDGTMLASSGDDAPRESSTDGSVRIWRADQGRIPARGVDAQLSSREAHTAALAHQGLGIAYLEAADYGAAERELRQAFEIQDRRVRTLFASVKAKTELAATSEAMALTLAKLGRLAEAEESYQSAMRSDPSPGKTSPLNYHMRVRRLKINTELAVVLALNHRTDQATEVHKRALGFEGWWRGNLDVRIGLDLHFSAVLEQVGEHSKAVGAARDVVQFLGKAAEDQSDWEAKNDLAWILITHPLVEIRDPPRAVDLANRATIEAPGAAACWNTLGVAHYRAENWLDALVALQKSMELQQGGTAADWFFMAMTYWQLSDKNEARHWYQKAADWMAKNAPQNDELLRFRAEAAVLMGVKDGTRSTTPED